VFGNDLVTRQNIMTQLVKRIVSPGHGPKPNLIPRQAVTRRGKASLSENCRPKHDTVIRVYDEAGNVIETHEHRSDFKEW
jgi:hypothetical protein